MLSADDTLAKAKCALQHMKNSDYLGASILLQEIVTARPDWEHGGAAYSLAICYEELGRLKDAKSNYLLALSQRPSDHLFWGGYAEFLYFHGEAEVALEAQLKFIEYRGFTPAELEEFLPRVSMLCEKLGLTEIQTNELIDRLRKQCLKGP